MAWSHLQGWALLQTDRFGRLQGRLAAHLNSAQRAADSAYGTPQTPDRPSALSAWPDSERGER